MGMISMAKLAFADNDGRAQVYDGYLIQRWPNDLMKDEEHCSVQNAAGGINYELWHKQCGTADGGYKQCDTADECIKACATTHYRDEKGVTCTWHCPPGGSEERACNEKVERLREAERASRLNSTTPSPTQAWDDKQTHDRYSPEDVSGACDTVETDGTQATISTKQTACEAHTDARTSCLADTDNKCEFTESECNLRPEWNCITDDTWYTIIIPVCGSAIFLAIVGFLISRFCC